MPTPFKDPDKRVRYFPGQYLLEEDFEHEQNYHRDRLQRLNRQLHVSGITNGLTVTFEGAGDRTVQVSAGDAIDNQGWQIVWTGGKYPGSSDDPPINNGDILYITYHEEPSKDDIQAETSEARRWQEKPRLSLVKTDGAIALAQFKVENGVVTIDVEKTNSVRQYSGLRLPSSDAANAPTLRSNGSNNPSLAVLSGSLKVTGNASVDGTLMVTGTSTLAGALTVTDTSTLSGKLTVRNQVELKGSANSTGLIVDSEGKVGIGTTNPTSSLSVAGGVAIGSYASSNAASNGQLIVKDKVGIGTPQPIARLDIQQTPRVGLHPTSIQGLYVTGDFGDSSGIEFRHSNGDEGIGFGFNTIYATGSRQNQDLKLRPRGIGTVTVMGSTGGISDDVSWLNITQSNTDFANFRFVGTGMGQLEFVGWSSGWNINSKTSGKHLYINRDTGESSNLYLGRLGKELFIRGQDGNVGIGTNTPGSSLSVVGGVAIGSYATSNAASSGQLIVQDKVGIGTSSPQTKLTIFTPSDYDGDVLRFAAKINPNDYYLKVKAASEANNVRWSFDQKNQTGNYLDFLTFDQGNVGIGGRIGNWTIAKSGSNNVIITIRSNSNNNIIPLASPISSVGIRLEGVNDNSLINNWVVLCHYISSTWGVTAQNPSITSSGTPGIDSYSYSIPTDAKRVLITACLAR